MEVYVPEKEGRREAEKREGERPRCLEELNRLQSSCRSFPRAEGGSREEESGTDCPHPGTL